jgi:hypothetical protein
MTIDNVGAQADAPVSLEPGAGDASELASRPMPISVAIVFVLAAAFAPALLGMRVLGIVDTRYEFATEFLMVAYSLYSGFVAWVARATRRDLAIIAIGIVPPAWLAMQWLGGNEVMGLMVGTGYLVAIGLAWLCHRAQGAFGVALGFIVGFIATLVLAWLPIVVMTPFSVF